MLTAALSPNLSGLFAEGDSIVVGATPDDEPLIVIRNDVVTLATGETVMAVALSPEDRTAELSTLDGAKRAAIDYAKRRPS